MKKWMMVIICMGMNMYALSQENPPATISKGRPFPDYVFDNVINYSGKAISMDHLKGKSVILDFWGTFCIPCIKAIPSLEDLQRKFGDSLVIIMIGIDGEKKIKDFFRRRKTQHKSMILPCAIDSKLFSITGLHSVPSEIWIDKKGIVCEITEADKLTETSIREFISGSALQIPEKKESRTSYDYSKPFLVNRNGGNGDNLIYHSVLSAYTPGLDGTFTFPHFGRGVRINALNCAIVNLYLQAYGNENGPFPLNRLRFEMDSSVYIYNGNDDRSDWYHKHAVCYELKVPEEKSNALLQIMKDDLRRLFPVKATIETKMEKCFVLVQTKKGILHTENGKPDEKYDPAGISVHNKTIDDFLGMLQYYFQTKIMINETIFTGKVDIKLDALMTDWNEVRNSLKKYGLDLIEAEKNVEVLVLKK